MVFCPFWRDIFVLMYGISPFRSIPTTFLSISLCATALAFHGLLQWSGLWTPQSMFPVCGNFDNPAGIASALAFSLPFSLHYTHSPCIPLRYTALASTLLMACAITASESRAGILSTLYIKERFGRRKVTHLAVYLEYDKRTPVIRIQSWRFSSKLHGRTGTVFPYPSQQPLCTVGRRCEISFQRVSRSFDRFRVCRWYGRVPLYRHAFPDVAETSRGKFQTGFALPGSHCRLFPVLLPIPLSAYVDIVYGFRPCFDT